MLQKHQHHCIIANCSLLISLLRYLVMCYLQEIQGQSRTGRFHHRPQKLTTETGKKNSQLTPTSCVICDTIASRNTYFCAQPLYKFADPPTSCWPAVPASCAQLTICWTALHSDGVHAYGSSQYAPSGSWHVQPDTWPWSRSPYLPLPFRSSITATGLLVGSHLRR